MNTALAKISLMRFLLFCPPLPQPSCFADRAALPSVCTCSHLVTQVAGWTAYSFHKDMIGKCRSIVKSGIAIGIS